MIIDKLGFYRTRGGEVVEVLYIMPERINTTYPVIAYNRFKLTYTKMGKYDDVIDCDDDLVEYLGNELPKPNKKVRLYQAILMHQSGLYPDSEQRYFQTQRFFKGVEDIKKEYSHATIIKFPANPDFYVEVEE
jgi:hypothetical protein